MNNSLQNQINKIIDNDFSNLKSHSNLLSETLIFNLSETEIENNFDDLSINDELHFLAKIDFYELSKFWKSELPTGNLYFYLKNHLDIYPLNRNDFKIIYCENQKTNIPINVNGFTTNIFESYTIPSHQESCILNLNIDDQDFQELEEIVLDTNSQITKFEYDFAHQIFGQPQALQGTVRFHWAIKFLGFELKSEYSEVELAQINNEEDYFILLLQINLADKKINFDVFGDSMLYFGIHKKDFENRNFENVILEIQNT